MEPSGRGKTLKGNWPNDPSGKRWDLREFIQCQNCLRTVTILPVNQRDGVTLAEARRIGWIDLPDGGWLCPSGCIPS